LTARSPSPARAREAAVQVRREPERAFVHDRLNAGRNRPRHVRDDDELVDLLAQHRQQELELADVAVRDDDRRDLHLASTFR
jgi:hypothetical protein